MASLKLFSQLLIIFLYSTAFNNSRCTASKNSPSNSSSGFNLTVRDYLLQQRLLLHNRHSTKSINKLPIVFVYTVVPAVCKYGLPEYIRISLEQSIFTQPDCDIYLLTNLGDCTEINKAVDKTPGLQIVDSLSIVSNRTRDFANVSTGMFARDYVNELWITSALRFFMLEDLVLTMGWSELLHVEADNLLYGRLTTILKQLREYPLAATPLNADLTFITASVFWISSQSSLIEFNDYLLSLGHNKDDMWLKYCDWLRPTAGKAGGVFPDKSGLGIKPFAINEMSMLAFYHSLYPNTLKLLPVVPARKYLLNAQVVNMSRFGPGGEQAGPITGHGIWDANSWGQYIGGTSRNKGKDLGFSDATHISGQAIRMSGCTVAMLCANMTEMGWAHNESSNYLHDTVSDSNRRRAPRCYTAPLVRCGFDKHWTPFWNLHVHSKHTSTYRSHSCNCHGPMDIGTGIASLAKFHPAWLGGQG